MSGDEFLYYLVVIACVHANHCIDDYSLLAEELKKEEEEG